MDDEELDNDGEIKDKPGGCGCRVTGTSTSPGALLGVLLLGGVFLRRRGRG
jgi:MYXO-CTERM domain-containing protein